MGYRRMMTASIATCVLMLAAQQVVLGLPKAAVAVTPEARMSGGAGSLIPNVSNNAVTKARVDNGQTPPGAVTIAFRTSDEAYAEDLCTMQGTVTPAPGSTEAIMKPSYGRWC